MSDEVTAPEDVQEVAVTESPADSEVEALEVAEDVAEETEGDPAPGAEGAPEEEGEEDGENEQAEPVFLKYRGKTLEVPAGTAPEVVAEIQKFASDVEADSTRKYQEAADARKAVEQRQQQLEKLANLSETQQELYARGTNIKAEIAQLESIDLNALWQSDPDRARRVSDQLAQKNAQFQQTVNELNQTETQANQAQEQYVAQQREAGRAVIEKAIPGFNPDPVIDYVMKAYADLGQSLTLEEAKANWPLNPGYAMIAQKAMLYDQMKEKAKPKPAAKAQTKPVTSMPNKGQGKASKEPKDMTPEEFSAWRYRTMAAKNA